MSGVEVAGLVFGIFPVVIETIKAYGTTCETFRTFRNYSREVRRIQKQYGVCRRVFLNECRLLLQLVVDDKTTHAMMEDADHSLWMDRNLDEQFTKCLRDTYDVCKDTIDDIQEILKEVAGKLRLFDVLRQKRHKGEKLKFAIRRLRDSIVIAFDKERYENLLSKLRDRNADIHLLRSQVGDLQQTSSTAAKACIYRKQLPKHYTTVQRASQKLHEAFSESWRCKDPSHTAHQIKLCLKAHVDDLVRLELALSYQNHGPNWRNAHRVSNLLWMYVQSVSVEDQGWLDDSRSSDQSGLARELSDALNVDGRVSILESPSSISPPCRKRLIKRRKVRFSDDCTTAQDALAPLKPIKDNQYKLDEIKNFCQHIEQRCSIRCGHGDGIGYLETPKFFKHIFYPKTKDIVKGTKDQDLQNDQQVISLQQLLCSRSGPLSTMNAVTRLKLGHRLATAVLQYQSTPWLNQEWRLRDVWYFGMVKKLSEESLDTLHVSNLFGEGVQERSVSDATSQGQGDAVKPPFSSRLEMVQVQYGVNNIMLFSLGISLLELGYHNTLESMAGQLDPIAAARRLAVSDHPLGLRYQRIVQQCLQCNFGMGTDLSHVELQSAVYGDVVCQLEEMIQSLSLD